MSIEAIDWGVIVVGRWNPALLTPAGIVSFVFGHRDSRPVNVLIPLDGPSPYLVESPDAPVVVSADLERLRIHPKEMNSELLAKAQAYGVAALQNLPRTPLLAAGINVKFKSAEPIPCLIEALRASVDGPLSVAGSIISSRGLERTIRFDPGVLNLTIKGTDAGNEVAYNFHRASQDADELIAWLRTPTETILSKVREIQTAIGLQSLGA